VRDVHLLSACCQQHALVLGRQAVSDVTGELGAISSFLASLPLAGATVTFDAEFTQWLVAKRVVDQGGAYLMVVNANQPSLLRCMRGGHGGVSETSATPALAGTPANWHGGLEQRSLLAVAARPDLASVCAPGVASATTALSGSAPVKS